MDDKGEKTIFGITRRDFIKIAGAAAIFPVIDKAAGLLVDSGLLPEGDPLQRVVVFQKLEQRLLLSPTTENKDLLISWVKMNAVEAYARNAGWDLAADTMRHFLYGGGTPMDITNGFIRSVEKSSERSLSRDERLANFLTKSVAPLVQSKPKIITPEKIDLESYCLKNTKIPIEMICQMVPMSPDIHFSLSWYGDKISGDASVSIVDNVYELAFDMSEHTVFDTYDWGPRTMPSEYLTSWFVLAKLGLDEKRLTELVGEERTRELISHDLITVGHQDPQLIEKLGYGKSFEEKGQFSINEPMTVLFPRNIK